MLDHLVNKQIHPVLEFLARQLVAWRIRPDQLTLVGFIVGMLSLPLLAMQHYVFALVVLLVNRVCDGMDGALARVTTSSDRGGYLDITLDFIFYGCFVLGFALANPAANSLMASVLLVSFLGTASSFLAYAIMVEKHQLATYRLPGKSFYYMGRGVEGTETVLMFVLFCLFPSCFPVLAAIFSGLCFLTTISRIVFAYKTLKAVGA
ncbi:Inner membrane protein YnjF [invertebrate metagenome]|uniref:Inner membrane protein YnjF n=1 Tax=invertebrate metagenome TaxID=1711999 RepID=A0A2H9TCL6_9ZZZZ